MDEAEALVSSGSEVSSDLVSEVFFYVLVSNER
jgi:hypothetical protein